jgi:hypothetical protein
MMAIYPRVLMINLVYSQVGVEGGAYGREYSSTDLIRMGLSVLIERLE